MEERNFVSDEFRELYGDEQADEMEEFMRHYPSSIEEFL